MEWLPPHWTFFWFVITGYKLFYCYYCYFTTVNHPPTTVLKSKILSCVFISFEYKILLSISVSQNIIAIYCVFATYKTNHFTIKTIFVGKMADFIAHYRKWLAHVQFFSRGVEGGTPRKFCIFTWLFEKQTFFLPRGIK